MRVDAVVAEILRREGVEILFGYPRNPILEAAARADIRTIIARQERTGLNMADGLSRVSSGERIGVFAMQHGPGTENTFGAVAQAFGDSVPMVILPAGEPRHHTNVRPHFNAALNFRHVTKWAEQVTVASVVPDALRRAFMQARNGRPGPVLVELPQDLLMEDIPEPSSYRRSRRLRAAPDPITVREAAAALAAADRPVIYAGQGIHYAKAWQQLVAFAELLAAPVCTSLAGKSAFPEHHPLALGATAATHPKPMHHFLHNADLIFGIGCSFLDTDYGFKMPKAKRFIHATLDPNDVDKDVITDHALVGDAALVLDALIEELRGRDRQERLAAVSQEVRAVKQEWLAQWLPRFASDQVPITPFRVVRELMRTVDVENTILTHDAGNPREQTVPFWESRSPLGYLGWGKTTQLGTGLGLALGAKLAMPDKLCINIWGDAAIGFTGMDLETAAREGIPILSILFNNGAISTELTLMATATAKYRATDLGGNYSEFARALGCWSERVADPREIVAAIRRGVEKTREGMPVLLEFMTEKTNDRASRH